MTYKEAKKAGWDLVEKERKGEEVTKEEYKTALENLLSVRFSGKDLADITSIAVNTYGFDQEGYNAGILNLHRTLQQSYVRMTAKALEKIGQQQWVDPRNENAVEFCRKITPVIEESGFPFI